MASVFIGGSRHITHLEPEVYRHVDRMVEKGLTILIGDVTGIDLAMQRYLADLRYANVVVLCMEGACRSNQGRWPTRPIRTFRGPRSVEFFAEKDRQMADEATAGLMVWNGESVGTATIINNLVTGGKPVAVYHTPTATTQVVRSTTDLETLLAAAPPAVRSRFAAQVMESATALSEMGD